MEILCLSGSGLVWFACDEEDEVMSVLLLILEDGDTSLWRPGGVFRHSSLDLTARGRIRRPLAVPQHVVSVNALPSGAFVFGLFQ